MSRVDEILELIDGALTDYELGPDAVRWTPEKATDDTAAVIYDDVVFDLAEPHIASGRVTFRNCTFRHDGLLGGHFEVSAEAVAWAAGRRQTVDEPPDYTARNGWLVVSAIDGDATITFDLPPLEPHASLSLMAVPSIDAYRCTRCGRYFASALLLHRIYWPCDCV